MAGIVNWWLTHATAVWVFAQFLFDLVALAWVITAGKILKAHQVTLTAMARLLFPDGPLIERER